MMLAALLLSADPFLIERIDTPEGVVPEVGGIDVDAFICRPGSATSSTRCSATCSAPCCGRYPRLSPAKCGSINGSRTRNMAPSMPRQRSGRTFSLGRASSRVLSGCSGAKTDDGMQKKMDVELDSNMPRTIRRCRRVEMSAVSQRRAGCLSRAQ